MIKCSKCGWDNEEINTYCCKCGTKVEKVIKEEKDENLKFQEEIDEINIGNNETKGSKFINLIKKKRTIKIASIILAVVCIVTFSGIGVYGYILKKSPVKWITKGLEKYMSANTMYLTTNIKMTVDMSQSNDPNSRLMEKIIKGMSIEGKSKINKKTKEGSTDIMVNFNGQPVLSGKVYVNDRNLVISIPSLYRNNIYFNIDELNNIANERRGMKIRESIDIEKYKPLLDLNKSKYGKKVSKTYLELLEDNLNPLFERNGSEVLNIENENGKKDEIKCEKLTLNMNVDQGIEVLRNIALKATEDEDLKNLLKEKLDEFFAIVDKNNDYEKLNISKEDIKIVKEEFSSKYDEGIKELKKEITDLKKRTNGDMKINLTSQIYMDSKDRIRGFDNNMFLRVDGEGSLNMVVENRVNSINERINIEKLSTNGGINLAKADEMVLEQIGEEIQKNFINILIKNISIK